MSRLITGMIAISFVVVSTAPVQGSPANCNKDSFNVMSILKMIHCVTGAGECKDFVNCDDAESGAFDVGYNQAIAGFTPTAPANQQKCAKDLVNVTHVVKMISCVIGAGDCKGFIPCDDGLDGAFDEGFKAGFAVACQNAGGAVADGACGGLDPEYKCDADGNIILTIEFDLGTNHFDGVSSYIFHETDSENAWDGYAGDIYVYNSSSSGPKGYSYYYNTDGSYANGKEHPDWAFSMTNTNMSITFPMQPAAAADKGTAFPMSIWGKTGDHDTSWHQTGTDDIKISSNGATIWTGSSKDYPCEITSTNFYCQPTNMYNPTEFPLKFSCPQ